MNKFGLLFNFFSSSDFCVLTLIWQVKIEWLYILDQQGDEYHMSIPSEMLQNCAYHHYTHYYDYTYVILHTTEFLAFTHVNDYEFTSWVATRVSCLAIMSLISWNSSPASKAFSIYLWYILYFSSFAWSFSFDFTSADLSCFNLHL